MRPTLSRSLQSRINRLAHRVAIRTEQRDRVRLVDEVLLMLERGETFDAIVRFLDGCEALGPYRRAAIERKVL